MGRGYARVGGLDQAMTMLDLAERGGFFCYPFFMRDPWIDRLARRRPPQRHPPSRRGKMARRKKRFRESSREAAC